MTEQQVAAKPVESEEFYVEVTDTYGDEANYAWVRRYRVRAASQRGAITKVARLTGYRFRKSYDTGDVARYDARHACVCGFVTAWDEGGANCPGNNVATI